MTTVVGVDACRGGWVFIRLVDGQFDSAKFHQSFAQGVNASADAIVIAVDMPIGFPPLPAQRRGADVGARALVGPRHSSVFPAPHPDVLHAPNYEEARQISRDVIGLGLPAPSFALREKILEVEPVARRDARLREIHPEVSFKALADRCLETSKDQWNGQMERRAFLAKHNIVIPDDLADAGTAGADDVLDAAAAAWSAHRIAKEQAIALPDPPEYDVTGRRVAIWY